MLKRGKINIHVGTPKFNTKTINQHINREPQPARDKVPTSYGT